MKSSNQPVAVVEKERIRAQISAQVEAFLSAGGKIDVVTQMEAQARASVGSVWHDHNQLVDVPE